MGLPSRAAGRRGLGPENVSAQALASEEPTADSAPAVRPKYSPLDRLVFMSGFVPSITASQLKVALGQFGEVERVVVNKDPTNPAVNRVTPLGASAVVEMKYAESALSLISDMKRMQLAVGGGPRSVWACTATKEMLDPDEWPHIFGAESASSPTDAAPGGPDSRGQSGGSHRASGSSSRKLILVDVSSETGGAPAWLDDVAKAEVARARRDLLKVRSAVQWQRMKEAVARQASELFHFEAHLLQHQRQLHEGQVLELDAEMKKMREFADVERSDGVVNLLISYYAQMQ